VRGLICLFAAPNLSLATSQIIAGLHVDPIFGRGPETKREAQCRLLELNGLWNYVVQRQRRRSSEASRFFRLVPKTAPVDLFDERPPLLRQPFTFANQARQSFRP
jgi:hypothetical protein